MFFIVAASAPLTAVAGGQAATYLVTGNKGVPFMFIPLGIMLALFAVGYAAMSRHVTNAGAFYAYVARGLGKVQAVGAAFVALIAYNAMQIGIYGLFGVAMGAFMADKIGIDLEWYWWCLIGGGVIGFLGVLQIDLNARVLAVLLILEVVVVALFDFAILADPGPEGITGVGFDPGVSFGTAVGATLTFCVASFVGFESAAIYSEEVKDPKKTVARATFIAIGLIAVFYALSSWLVGIAAGPNTIVDPVALAAAGFGTRRAPDPTTVLFITGAGPARRVLGRLRLAAVRHEPVRGAAVVPQRGLALHVRARSRARAAARLQPRARPHRRAVHRVVHADGAGAGVVIVFALADADPVLKLFTWLTNLGALGVLLLMAVTSFAVVAYFRRNPEAGVSAWAGTIAPAIAGVALLVVLVLGVPQLQRPDHERDGRADRHDGDRAAGDPFGAGAFGLALGAWMKSSKPDDVARIGEGAGAEK